MAKRVIQECDLTKHEYEPDETVKLIITRNGKKGRTYELSPDAANKLEQQLVGGNKLPDNWSFGSTQASTIPSGPVKRTLGDLDATEDDSRFVASKKSELREAGVIEDQRQETVEPVLTDVLDIPKAETNGCRHLNKGRIQATLSSGKRLIYRLCNDCRSRVPELTKEERSSYMEGKISDPDVRVREIGERE